MVWLVTANALTALRLVALPFLVHAIHSGDFTLALGICLGAGLTDAADGALARRSGSVSRFGAYFDPISDKIFLATTFIALGYANLVPWWLVGTIFGRDLLILLSAAILLRILRHRDFPPSRLGKFSTLLQISLAFFTLFHQVVHGTETAAVLNTLTYAVFVVTVWSGVHYGWRTARVLERRTLRIDAPVGRE